MILRGINLKYVDGGEDIPVDPVDPGEDNDHLLPFIETKNVFQGAVTTTGFRVNAKMQQSGQARLRVYSDSARANLVAKSNLAQTDVWNVCQFTVNGLQPGNEYWWAIESGGRKAYHIGKMRTFPQGPASYKIVASSCAGNMSPGMVTNHIVFDGIKLEHGDALLFIHMGDMHYKDIPDNVEGKFDSAYDEVLSKTRQQNLYMQMPMAYIFNDHDFGTNDSDGTAPSKPAAIQSYKRRFPHYPLAFTGATDPVGQTWAIGRVRYIFPDVLSDKLYSVPTYIGERQKQWIKDTMLSCEEPVICLIVSDPWITSTEGVGWYDAVDERDELMQFFHDNDLTDRLFIINGDSHLLGFDDGSNNQGIPVFCCSPLHSGPSIKGGPYSEGIIAEIGQFGTFEVQDNGGDTITIKGTGWRYDGSLIEVMSHTMTFDTAPFVEQVEITDLNGDPLSSIEVGPEPNEFSFRVVSNTNWSLSSNRTWLSFDTTEGADGTTTVKVTCAENPDQERGGSITVATATGEATASLSVLQQQITVHAIDVLMRTPDFVGGFKGAASPEEALDNQVEATVYSRDPLANIAIGTRVYTNSEAEELIEGGSTWYKVESGSLVLQIDDNGYITGIVDTDQTLSVSPTAMSNFSSSGGSFTVNVTSNTDWEVGMVSGWMSVPTAQRSGSGNGSFTVNVSPNTLTEGHTEDRSGSLTVSTGDNYSSVQVHVSQKGTELPDSISPTYTNIGSGGGTVDIEIETPTEPKFWSVVQPLPPGISEVYPNSGTGSGSIEVSVSVNTGPQRVMEIDIDIEGATYTCAIAQERGLKTEGKPLSEFSLKFMLILA